MSTLLLNSSYEPIRVISTRRAIILVLQGKADVLEVYPQNWTRSANVEMETPAVVKLNYFVKIPYRSRLPLTRQAVLTRDNFECQFTHCTRKGTTIDHVHPRSRGGRHEWENVVAACSKCNAKKSDRTLEEIDWKLKKEPRAVAGNKWLLIGLRAHELWKPYLSSDW